MNSRWVVAGAIIAVTASSVATGLTEAGARAGTADREVAAFVSDDSLPAVTVLATRPTLSEILDLVLHERPTAAELASSSTGHGGFPVGSDEDHIAGILRLHTQDASLVNRIASAVVREGRRRNIGSSLLVGLLLTENADLNPRATSPVGARGLMQVMPFHAGKWGCASSDLFDIESNICHGVAILADNLVRSRNLPQALLGYNGFVRGTNTPGCWRYPEVVYGHARKGADRIAGSVQPFARRHSAP